MIYVVDNGKDKFAQYGPWSAYDEVQLSNGMFDVKIDMKDYYMQYRYRHGVELHTYSGSKLSLIVNNLLQYSLVPVEWANKRLEWLSQIFREYIISNNIERLKRFNMFVMDEQDADDVMIGLLPMNVFGDLCGDTIECVHGSNFTIKNFIELLIARNVNIADFILNGRYSVLEDSNGELEKMKKDGLINMQNVIIAIE
jgi:hypothetical protein